MKIVTGKIFLLNGLLVILFSNPVVHAELADQDYFELYPDEKNEILSSGAIGRRQRGEINPSPPSTESGELAWVLETTVLPRGATKGELERFLIDRLPPLQAPGSSQKWDQQKSRLRQDIMEKVVMKGHDPAIFSEKPAVQWQESIETEHGYRIRRLCYEMWPGLWGPALIYEPVDVKGNVPVVLNAMGHGGVLSNDFRQTRAINQAKRGMIAMVIEWIGSGGQLATSREIHGYVHEAWIECFEICGRSGMAPYHTTVKRALDVLLDHPNADPARVAMTGYSSGGTQSLWLGALDERVTVCIPSAGHAGNEAAIKHYGCFGCPSMVPTDLWSLAGFSQLTAMLAPRPTLLIYNKFDNCCWQSEWVRPSLYEPILPYFNLYDLPENYVFFEGTEPGHNYGRMNREAVYRFLNQHFFDGQGIDEEIPCKDELLWKELKAKLPAGSMNIHQYFEKYSVGLPEKTLAEAAENGTLGSWRKGRIAALTETIKLKSYAAATVSESKEIASSRYQAKGLNLKIGDDWHIPAIDIAARDVKPHRIAIVMADGGRKEAADLVADLLKDAHRCLVVDVLFIGECFPVSTTFPNAEFGVHSFGERNLGIKVGQLLAVLDYAAGAYPDQPITLAGVGLNSSVTAVLATALSAKIQPETLVTEGLPVSLRVLVHRSLFRAYSLFNFGLLKEADIVDMLALTLPAQVQLINMDSSNYQWKYAEKRSKRVVAGYKEITMRPFVNRAATFKRKIDVAQEEYRPLSQ